MKQSIAKKKHARSWRSKKVEWLNVQGTSLMLKSKQVFFHSKHSALQQVSK